MYIKIHLELIKNVLKKFAHIFLQRKGDIMINKIMKKAEKFIHDASFHPCNIKNNEKIYIGRDLIVCRQQWGGWVVCPTWNMDVAVGSIRDGVIEESVTKFVMQNLHIGDNFINVGANFGYYVSLGGNIVGPTGHVWGFEANPEIFRVLIKTLFYSGVINHTTVYNRAVSNINDKELEFFFDYQFLGGGRHPAYSIGVENDQNLFWDSCDINSLLEENGKFLLKGLYSHFFQKTITLDSVIATKKIDFLLCDAETAEPYVILGAQDIIKRSEKIKIVFEYTSINYKEGTKQQQEAIVNMLNFLKEYGFIIKIIQPNLVNGEVVLSDPIDYQAMIHDDFGVENFLASRS